MTGGQDGDQAPKKEQNLYLATLKGCHDTLIPQARDDVYAGQGNAGSPIATAIGDGGWVCPEATKWVEELTEHTKGILDAFDDAAAAVRAEMVSERHQFGGDEVPEHHPHGLAWSRTWHIIRRNL